MNIRYLLNGRTFSGRPIEVLILRALVDPDFRPIVSVKDHAVAFSAHIGRRRGTRTEQNSLM